MAEPRAPLQQVLRRIDELRANGKTTDEQVAEVTALGWRPEEIKERVSRLRPSGGDIAAQAIPFMDEITAGVFAPLRTLTRGLPLKEAYEQGLEEERAAPELYRQQNPALATAMDIGSGFLLPTIGGPTTTMLGAMGKAAGNAGIQGLLQGLGSGEGGENRLERGFVGGGAGALIGGALGLTESILRGLYSQAAPNSTARQILAQALADEGLTPDQAAARIAEATAAGSPGTLIPDIGQEGGRLQVMTKDITNNPNRMQSPLREQIARRQMGERGPLGEMAVPGQYERTAEILGSISGTGGKRAVETTREIVARRQRDATPLFQAANEFDPAGDDIVRLTVAQTAQTPVFEKAWPRAVKIARSRAPGVPIPSKDDVINGTAIPNMQFLHFLKEGMDDAVNAAYKAGDTNLGGAFKDNRNSFRNVLKTRNPAYRDALDAYAGEKALENALTDGRSLIMKSPDEMIAAIDGLSASEQEAFRIGALTEVVDLLGRAPRGPATDTVRKLSSPVFVRKMAALMPDDAARQRWFAFADAEAAKSVTAKAQFGSQTQSLQAADEAMADGSQAAEMLGDLGRGVSGGFWSMFQAALSKVSTPVANALKARRRGALGELLAQPDSQAEALLRSLTAQPPLPGYLLERLALPATTGVLGGTDLLPEARPVNRDLGF